MAEFYPLIQRIIDSGKCRVEADYHGLGAAHYDLIQAWDGDAAYYLQWARRQGDPVLELGAGTGRISIGLARAGHLVTALDASEDMLSVLRTRLSEESSETSKRITAVQADMRDFDLGQQFPLIIMPLYTLAHINGPADRARTFDCIARHLAPCGALALDVELDRGGRDLRRDEFPVLTSVNHDPDEDLLVLELSQTRPVPGHGSRLLLNLLRVVVDSGGAASIAATSSVEDLVSEDEIRDLLASSGLELEGLYRNYGDEPLRPSDTSAVVVARLKE